MSATSVTLRGRAAAEALMLDACTVKRVTSSSTDPDTGVVTPTYSTVYTGKCKVQVQARAAIARPATVGEAAVFVSTIELHIPMAATGVASDDLVTVTASALDPDLVGRTWHIRELGHKSFMTARRFSMAEVTS